MTTPIQDKIELTGEELKRELLELQERVSFGNFLKLCMLAILIMDFIFRHN